MQVIYLSKKKMLVGAFIIAAAMVLLSWLYAMRQVTVPTITEPIYQGLDTEKHMALTFNVDWGQEYLPDILATLEKKKVKTTFFLTGRWARKYPEYAKKLVQAGHEIGNHGLKHRSPNGMSLEENRRDIKEAEKYIEEVTGVRTRLFAPASGEREAHVLRAAETLGYKTVLWSIDTVDWRRDKSAAQIVKKVMGKAHNGAIVLMHPTEATAAALPDMIEQLQASGYSLKTVSQILPQDN